MSALVGDIAFDFAFPSCEPATPPSFSFDPSLLEIPYNAGHGRSSSRGSVYSMMSAAESTPDSVSTRMTTPSRASPPIRQHGPILLPKIRSQDQAIESPPKRVKTTSPRARPVAKRSSSTVPAARPSHARSFTNPETISSWSMPYCAAPEEMSSASLLCSPVTFAQDDFQSRRSSTCDGGIVDGAVERYGFPTYRQLPNYLPAANTTPQMQQQPMQQQQQMQSQDVFNFSSYVPRAPSPLSLSASATPDPVASTTLLDFLTGPNPAPSLVRTISFPLRDPNTKNFWWDVRQIRSWTDFSTPTIMGLPGAQAILNCPVPAPLLPTPAASHRHPENEASLHQIYASHYIPRLNAALGISSTRPLQFAASPKSASTQEPLFVATAQGDSSSAAAIFGGKPSARVVGLVRSFDRFNTGMRVEGNIKRVEYLRGLSAVHHAMREHGCRYGFILTEIELVVVRNGTEATPHFGFLEVAAVQLAAALPEGGLLDLDFEAQPSMELTACLALWGLCMMAGDEALPGQVHWRADIGAPAEGTRRKALARDSWMPQPQLAEKREAKRARGWVMPEDAVGRKELGKRGVRYGTC